MKGETACKPGSVDTGRANPAGPAAIPLGPGLPRGSSHLPASIGRAGLQCVSTPRLPIWCCSGWRLPRFTPRLLGRGLVSVALFVTSPCQGVTLHPALRSPDFPLCRLAAHSGCLADSRGWILPPAGSIGARRIAPERPEIARVVVKLGLFVPREPSGVAEDGKGRQLARRRLRGALRKPGSRLRIGVGVRR